MIVDRVKLEEIQRLLQYHRNLGIDVYPKTESISSFLCRPLSSSPVPQRDVTEDIQGQRNNGVLLSQDWRGIRSSPKTEGSSSPVSQAPQLAAIRAQIGQCEKCGLAPVHSSRITGDALRGSSPERPSLSSDIFLMIVGDWLHHEKGKEPLPELVFGYNEDQMLERMLKAITLEKKNVYVTNSVKCVVRDEGQIRATHIGACLSYLFQEIAALQPKIICAMGPVATKALCTQRLPLSRLRGRLHRYSRGGVDIPLLATYHPSYLLKNPEMKRATWVDLQILQKKLREITRHG